MKNKEALDLLFPEVGPDWIDPSIKSKYKLRRYDRGSSRYYYLIKGEKIISSYISNTSVTSQILPTGQGLKNFIGRLGVEAAEKYMQERAVYGTIYHQECLRPLVEGGSFSFVDFEKRFPEMIPEWCKHKWVDWVEPMKRNLMSFFLFVKERVVKVHGIEVPLKSDFWQIAGTGDLICDIEFNRKVVTACVDIKSGTKGFYEAHELQLKMLREEWNETYPDIPVTHLFNVAPVDYKKGVVKYKMENQTDKMTDKVKYRDVELEEWELHLMLAKAKGLVRPPSKFSTVWGAFDDIKEFDPEKHSFTYNL